MSTPSPGESAATDATTPNHYGPSHTVLLLLDFHSIFVNMVEGSTRSTLLQVAVEARNWAKSQGIQVLHCLVDVNTTPFPTCKNYDQYVKIMTGMKQNGAEEPAKLRADDAEELTFMRRLGHTSALKSPGLEEYLQKKGIKSLLLAGLSTSGCVMKTAFAAYDAEYVVTVISDGCADKDESLHNMLVGGLLKHRGYVATASEVRSWFSELNDGR